MCEQKSNEATYWTKSEIVGLMKFSTHATKKVKGELKEFEDVTYSANSRNKSKKVTLNEKMVKEYQKKINQVTIKGNTNDILKCAKRLDEAVRSIA